MGLKSVLDAVDNNKSITSDFKDNIKELITILNTFFPMVDLTNLKNRLENIKIVSSSKLVTKDIMDYHPVDNELCFNLEELKKDYDVKHVLMNALIRIATSHDQTFGFDQNDKLKALNMGYTEILTNFVVGNKKDSLYDDEVIATNLISNIVGPDILFQAYFTNNPNSLVNTLVNNNISMDTMELMNYNFELSKNGKESFESKLADIQIMLAKSFALEPRSLEVVNDFEANLYGDSKVFKDEASYNSINGVYKLWEDIKKQMTIKSLEESKTM